MTSVVIYVFQLVFTFFWQAFQACLLLFIIFSSFDYLIKSLTFGISYLQGDTQFIIITKTVAGLNILLEASNLWYEIFFVALVVGG